MNYAQVCGLVSGGHVGIQKLVAAVSQKSVRRWFALSDADMPQEDMVRQISSDASEKVMERVIETIEEYDPSKAGVSTWIYNLGWYIAANHCRDTFGETFGMIRNSQSDSECRPGQAWDRLIHDHGMVDTRTGTNPDMADRQMDAISESVRDNPRMAEFVRISREEYGKDSGPGVAGRIAERMGVSNAQISHYRTQLADMLDSATLAESVV
jgi:hypothetical protein